MLYIPEAEIEPDSHHAAALSWADGDAAWTNADGGVIAPTIPIVAIGAVPPDLNIDALNIDALRRRALP